MPKTPQDSSKYLLHVAQVQIQGPDRYLDFTHRKCQGGNQQQQGNPENNLRPRLVFHIDQKHAQYTQQQAGNPQNLHGTGQLQPFSQIVDLPDQQTVTLALELGMQAPDHRGISQKTVGIGQQNQRNGRK